MPGLLPDALKALWSSREARGQTVDQAMAEQGRLIGEYADVWADALRLPNERNLLDSLLREIQRFATPSGEGEIIRRWTAGDSDVADEWRTLNVDPSDPHAVEAFYDQSRAYVFELMRWHSLATDNGPLAYVVALRFAEEHGCRDYLDFGSGVGSGAILFARHGFEVTLADISSSLMNFARRRLQERGVSASWIDLKSEPLPSERYDIVTAMDVWEHLVEPVRTAADVARALRPGGFLFGRFAAEPDPNTPQHILFDFEPTFRQFERDRLVRVWFDDWLWGHQVFQKQ